MVATDPYTALITFLPTVALLHPTVDVDDTTHCICFVYERALCRCRSVMTHGS